MGTPVRSLLAGTEHGVYLIPFREAGEGSKPRALGLEGSEVDPLVKDALDANRLYAACAEDGLWTSKDAGTTWNKAWQPPAGSTLYTIATHPSESGKLYAGLEPAAVWSSDDAGQTWRELDALQTVPDKEHWRFFPPRQAHVRALTVITGKPETLYVGIEEGGVYLSEDGGQTFHSRNEGVYRDIHEVFPFPENSKLLLATTGDGFYRSEDAGQHWRHITQGMTRSYTVPLYIDPAPPHHVYVAAAAAPPPSWERGDRRADAKVFRSQDRGLTWEDWTTGFPCPQKGMIFCLVPHSTQPDYLFAATTDGKIFWSNGEGRGWKCIAEGLPPVYSLVVTG